MHLIKHFTTQNRPRVHSAVLHLATETLQTSPVVLLVVLVKKETIYSEARFIILCLPFVPLAALAFCQDFSVLVILFPDTSVFALCPQPCCCVVPLIQWHGLPISLSQLVSHRFFIFICIYLLFSHYIQLIVATDFIYLLYMSKHNK